MNSKLAPTYTQQVGDNSILWFEKSNRYIIVENKVLRLIQCFLNSNSKAGFEQYLVTLEMDSDTTDSLYQEISSFLKDCNIARIEQEIPDISFDRSKRNEPAYYRIDNQLIEVNFESEDIKNLIHPQLAHLSVHKNTQEPNHVFDIYVENDEMCLFQNESIIGSYPLKEYHLLQGKFAMLLLCVLAHTKELDWLGTFHASTIERNGQAVMVIGDSGSGKSTFTALLLANNYNVLADDITPILASDQKVYKYPGGISIKSGAFKLLNSVIPDFGKLPEFYINPYKGYVKYVPSKSYSHFLKGYPCKSILCINYQEGEPVTLESMPINEALEVLIPESWLAPQPERAQQFLDWIKDVSFYKLTYSNHQDAISKFSELFDL